MLVIGFSGHGFKRCPPTSIVTFTLVNPPVVVSSEPTKVEIHLQFNGLDNRDGVKLLEGEANAKRVLADIPVDSNTITVDISKDRAGIVQLFVEDGDGKCLSPYAYVAAVPSVVAHDFGEIFDRSVQDIVKATESGAASHIPVGALQLQDNPLLARKVAWQSHIHPMVMDFGGLVEHLSKSEDQLMTEASNPSPGSFTNRIEYLLRFFLVNKAFKAGNFLLQYAFASGEMITLNGVPLSADSLDLEALQKKVLTS